MQSAVSSILITPPRPVPAAAAPVSGHSRFRPDIEGLRAVAVTLVVLSHAGAGRFAGGYVGVDVFFVISGFLITTLLLAEQTRAGRISLRRFYARRALRLLPVATVVVLSTVAGAWFLLPATRFHEITVDALYSTFYGINWRLAGQGVDYMAAAAEPSPLQHLWSLAVEEQFYLVWPLLILITARSRRLLVAALSVLVAGSLTLSVWQTGESAPWAYFGSHTRAWELGAGALVAVGSARLATLPRGLAAALSWVGLAAVGAAALTFTEETSFPGYAALLPVLGTAVVIAAGLRGTRWGAGSLLGLRPLREIGKLSYGWYLWHWPILIIGAVAWPEHPYPLAAGSLLLALVTYHLVENPLRSHPRLRARARTGLLAGLVFSLLTVTVAAVGGRFTPAIPYGPPAVGLAAELSAATDPQARLSELIDASAHETRMPSNLTPPVTSPRQEPAHDADGCHVDFLDTEVRPCVYGDQAAKRTVFLIGDSRAGHWFAAVDNAARNQHWRLVALTKSACQIPQVLVYNVVLKRPYTECVQWRDAVFARIARERPQMVVVASNDLDNGSFYDESGTLIPTGGRADDVRWAQRWEQSFRRLAGIPAVLLQDTPWPAGIAPACLAAHARKTRACVRPVAKAIYEPNRRALIAEKARAAGIRVVDPTPWLCTTVCPPIIGDTLVYRDKSHLTQTYAAAVTPLLEKALFPAG
ncbi:acyltransferase [Actinoplanes lobatus]|uniref:Acyltransferase n=1 Tax=Actinoplanes lobatus TaxID=113568 RepID=A0A7W7HPR8_9ACTN|nr:acyltransferase family protein [Actinoplanes lobatus]MBB4754419.1 peptidoglycan/LPS O-acetylase OafA/YrhL [Actinoplanes lobatus]GGN62931.1 acyltransferase [Actinoplanes lobatus]GIE40501.1 acyltransferase [Actinoplanes lobatus]